jgi:Ser/Thr protein kinase RdoA (MazF antagonist)
MEKFRYFKKYKRQDRLRTEIAALSLLSNSPLHDRTPMLLKQGVDSSIEIQMLPGSPNQQLTEKLSCQVGQLAQEIHSIGNWSVFGRLGSERKISNPFTNFYNLLEDRISQWESRLPVRIELISRYISWIRSELPQTKLEINKAVPIFCHGDLDLKNILVEDGKISGIIDWEDAGVFCVEWELRKLSKWFDHKNTLWKSFIDGYGGSLKNDSDKRLELIKRLEAIDLLGHLGWCIENNKHDEYENTVSRIKTILNASE